MAKRSITYAQVGDNYDTKDPIKKLALTSAAQTAKNLKKRGFSEISATRGESAFVWRQGKILMASVVEGLGTKNLVADEMYKKTRKSYYDVIGHDTVATIINDLVSVGARPLIVHAYWAIQDNSWLQDEKRMRDLINGWKTACDLSGATWGGGETPTLKGIIENNTIDLGGSAIGIIEAKKFLVTDTKLRSGDRILFIRSNGINANGLSLARAVAKKLSKGYMTKLSNGSSYGDSLLTKTNIYARLIEDLQEAGIDIHYISNITGHGIRKLMRARPDFTYVIEHLTRPQAVFDFIQTHASLTDRQMYETYNMGTDFAIFLSSKNLDLAKNIVRRRGFSAFDGGYIEKGKRQVILKPKNITFDSSRLDLR